MIIYIASERYKYYAIWYICEGSFVISGLSYNGLTQYGQERYDRYNFVDGFGIEFTSDLKERVNKWNLKTKEWMNLYIKERIPESDKRKKIKEGLYVGFIAGTLHGFMVSYYFSFIIILILFKISKVLKKYRELFRWMPEILLNTCNFVLSFDFFVVSTLSLTIALLPFFFKDIQTGIMLWSQIYLQLIGNVLLQSFNRDSVLYGLQ